MKQALLTLIYLSSLLFLNVELQAQTHDFDYSLEQTSKPAQVRLTNMKIMKENYQLVLRGKVICRTYNSHVIPDHIDYEITDADDMIVDKGVIDTINGLNLRHLRDGRQFSYVLPDNLPAVGRLKLSWYTN